MQSSQTDLTDVRLEDTTPAQNAAQKGDNAADSDVDSTGALGTDTEHDETPRPQVPDINSPMLSTPMASTPTEPPATQRGRDSPSDYPRGRDFAGHQPRSYDRRSFSGPIAPRAPSAVRTEYGGDDDDNASVRTDMTTRTLKANRPQPVTKSRKIANIQNVFTESQKIAYVGLCYLSIVHFRTTRLQGMKKATQAYDEWANQFMERLYIYLDVMDEGACKLTFVPNVGEGC